VADVVTGEAVILDVPIAGFPARLAALLLDVLIQIVLIVVTLIVVLPRAGHLDAASLTAISLTAYVLIIVGYPTIFETLTRGKSPGKTALGLRVVGDDGSPERFRQALVRALVGVLEIWVFFIGPPIALITSMMSARGKRLGDLAAGTFVIAERVPARRPLAPELAVVPPPLAGWATSLELSRLSDQTAEAAASYLRRYADLRPAARDQLGLQLATAVAGQVSPPPPAGTPPAAYLAAVLAVRRDRDHARLAARYAAGAGPPRAAGPGPGGYTPPPGNGYTPPPGNGYTPPPGSGSGGRPTPGLDPGPGRPLDEQPDPAGGAGGFTPPA